MANKRGWYKHTFPRPLFLSCSLRSYCSKSIGNCKGHETFISNQIPSHPKICHGQLRSCAKQTKSYNAKRPKEIKMPTSVNNFSTADRIFMFGMLPSGNGSSQFFRRVRTPWSRNSCWRFFLWNRDKQENITVSYKQMTMCTGSGTTGKIPDILLGENIYEQRKLHKLINGWLWLPIQVRIFFGCYLELGNELFHYNTNICTRAIILLLLLTTLEESLNFIVLTLLSL